LERTKPISPGKVVVLVVLPAEIFWRIFEKTGSIVAYIMYKKMLVN